MAATALLTLERPPVLPAEAGQLLQSDDTFSAIGDQARAWLQTLGVPEIVSPIENRLRTQNSDFAGTVAAANTVRVQDLQEEARIQEEHARGLGALVIGEVVGGKANVEEAEITGLRSSLDQAVQGFTESLAANIDTAQTEALTSVGVMPDVRIVRGPDGHLQQGGQDLYSVAKNSIEQHPGDHPGLHKITQNEGLNYHALDVLDKTGYFDKGYVWVVPRMAPKDTPPSSIRQYGYFENLAVSWSFIWKTGPDQFVLRPMFTAGVNPEAREEVVGRKMTDQELNVMYGKRLDRRHDIFAVSGVYQDLGMPAPGSVEEAARGFLMLKNSFKNPDHPEADIGGRFDSQLGPSYYQGLKGARGDYVSDGQVRVEALRQLRDSTPAIIKELVEQRHELHTDMNVAYRMAALVKRHAVDYVIDRPELLPIIGSTLGLAARKAIEEHAPELATGGNGGRIRIMIHDMARAQTCGFGGFGGLEDGKGPLVFQCENGHYNTRPYGATIPKCAECSVSVDKC